jgi:hypothetical protein
MIMQGFCNWDGALVPFAIGATAPMQLSASLVLERASLRLRYHLRAPLSSVRLPPLAEPRRAPQLWRHTCFELFVGFEGSTRYHEYNFSPSRQWAAYEFESYRDGMRELAAVEPPAVAFRAADGECMLTAVLPVGALRLPNGRSRLGLAAVIEQHDGSLSYWAISHRAMKPDFHRAESFEIAIDWDRTVVAGPP